MTKFLDKTGVEHLVQKTKELISDAIYVHPSSSGNKHIPSGGSSGQILRWSADGEAAWGADKDTTYSAATASAAGLMSASDKSKLDGIATGATKTAVDSALSSTSTNPVQNKVINSALAGKASTSHTHAISDITDLQKTLDGKASASHTHSYAGSASAGGSATSAVKLDSSAGSVTQPVYFSNGKPVATTYALNKTVPSNAVFTDTTYSAATTSAAGLMSASDKSKLDGIASGANNYTYTLPTATSSALGGVKTGSNITNSSGTISITKANVTSALGYTPPTTNTTYSAATASVAGLMSATDKSKLDGIASGAEVNQNAFSNVIVGETAISADGKTDTLTFAGSNVTLTPDATNDKITIGITKANVVAALGYTPPTSDTNTTYSAATTSAAGLMSASDKSKLDGITASADSVSFSQSLSSGTKVGTITINGTGTDLYAPTNTDTTYSVVSTSADGLAPKRDGSTTKFLRGDGTWAVPPDTNTTYSSLKNPYALTIQGNGTTLTNGTYDGSAAKKVNITPASIGAAASSHTHDSLKDNIDGLSSIFFGAGEYSGVTGVSTIVFNSLAHSGKVVLGYTGDPAEIPIPRLFSAELLYANDSGTTGTVTLSRYANTCAFIDIIYGTGEGRASGTTRVYSPEGKVAEISCGLVAANGFHNIYFARYTISGTTMTVSNNSYCGGSLNADKSVTENGLHVLAVIGYR